MGATSALVVCLGVALFALLALEGDKQFAARARIPIHWGIDMRPNGWASRRFGLALFPVIGTVLLLALALSGQPVFVLAAVLLGLAAGNLVYFRAISHTPQGEAGSAART
jgi:hypothetical protein